MCFTLVFVLLGWGGAANLHSGPRLLFRLLRAPVSIGPPALSDRRIQELLAARGLASIVFVKTCLLDRTRSGSRIKCLHNIEPGRLFVVVFQDSGPNFIERLAD